MKNCNRWEEGGEQQDSTYERVDRIASGQDSEEGIEAKKVKREENKKAEGGYKGFCSVLFQNKCFPVAVGSFHLCAKILNTWL